MTLIIGAIAKNGVILIGDKRTFFPDKIFSYHDRSTKIFKVNNLVGIAGAGEGDDVEDVLKYILSLKLTGDIDAVVSSIESEVKKRMANWYMNPNNVLLEQHGKVRSPYYVILIAGFTNKGQPKLCSIPTDNIRIINRQEDFHIEGVTDVGYPLFKTKHKATSSIEDTEKLAISAIEETAKISMGVCNKYDSIKIEFKK
ncbi:hypothetical protein HY612_01430 [Candidatus Roizmanbacteria bacterium]|nr:hypothetical protein [Candidatus Roizmanbacteria bacterium]